MRHHFTVDVEEHFQVSAFEGSVSREDWDGFESRVAGNVERLLALLAEHDARGTFFVLGWIAERHPGIVRDIAAAGCDAFTIGGAALDGSFSPRKGSLQSQLCDILAACYD